jgi:hypothetical protein
VQARILGFIGRPQDFLRQKPKPPKRQGVVFWLNKPAVLKQTLIEASANNEADS